MKGFEISYKNKELTFVDSDLRKHLSYSDSDFLEIVSETVYVYINNVTYYDIFDMLEIDRNKIDFAYPEQLRDIDKTFDLRIRNGDHPFWNYNNDSYGAPLWKSEIMMKFTDLCRKLFFEHVFEKCNTYEV